MVGIYDFTILQGSDKDIPITIQDSEGANYLDSGKTYSAYMQIRPSARANILFDDLSSSNGRITLDTANSKLTLHFPESITNSYEFSEAVYDLEIHNDTDNTVLRILEGTVTNNFNVTREN